jgi:arylformamidase
MANEFGGDYRVLCDFEIEFLNGGGLQGQGFRLDLHGDDLSDAAVARALVQDLRLLMVKRVEIRNRRVIAEAHKRAVADQGAALQPEPRFLDLSHVIEDGMITYKGLPAPHVCDFLSREASASHYSPATTFQIGRIDMVANTGTYIDAPFHRFVDGHDIAQLGLPQLADLDAVVVRVTGSHARAIDAPALAGVDVAGKAVLVHTGWARHWRTEQYFEGHSYLTAAAASYLREEGAVLVGIDSFNIDDTADGRRPVHTLLLGAGIPIVEHLRGLEQLPLHGFRFSAVPPPVKGMGTFPVRAFAAL